MKTATPTGKSPHLKDGALFRLDPPYLGHEYVALSYSETYSPETYIFACGPGGVVTDWSELRGSIRGTASHQEVLRDLGYEILP